MIVYNHVKVDNTNLSQSLPVRFQALRRVSFQCVGRRKRMHHFKVNRIDRHMKVFLLQQLKLERSLSILLLFKTRLLDVKKRGTHP